MPAYRLYRVDGAGKIATAEWLEAADDDSALVAARDSSPGSRWELWQRQRLICRTEPEKT